MVKVWNRGFWCEKIQNGLVPEGLTHTRTQTPRRAKVATPPTPPTQREGEKERRVMIFVWTAQVPGRMGQAHGDNPELAQADRG